MGARPSIWRTPRTTVGSEDTNVAMEHQHHGNSQTEAALFNVNIDFFFKRTAVPSLSLSLTRSLSLLLIYLISLKT